MAIAERPKLRIDPLARATPGQSFADPPGVYPWENPPTTSDPIELAETLKHELKDQDTSGAILDLLEIGISAETISEGVMQKCFVEGICSPDVAELVKPIIFMTVAQIGYDGNLGDVKLFNEEMKQERLTTEEKIGYMEKMAPDKYQELLDSLEQEEILNQEIDRAIDTDEDEDDEEPFPASQDSGSFLDMEEGEEMPMEYAEEGMEGMKGMEEAPMDIEEEYV
jgi:hypothetical protein